jgi:hypothetical protein
MLKDDANRYFENGAGFETMLVRNYKIVFISLINPEKAKILEKSIPFSMN